MAKIVLPDASPGNSGWNRVNDNFRKIEEEFQDKVLYRDNPSGEPNEMNNDLDMNSNRVYNLPTPVLDHEAAPWGEVKGGVPAAKEYAEQAKQSAIAAGISAGIAAGAAVVATTQAERAEDEADRAEAAADSVSGAIGRIDDLEEVVEEIESPTGSSVVGFIQNGTGSVTRTVQDKLRERVTVKDFGASGNGAADDTSAIQDAVDFCLSIGEILFWPAGDYITTASITGLHSISHRGPGRIVRGANKFAPGSMLDTETNTLFVAQTGSATNDGLSADQPLTFRESCNVLKRYGPHLNGKWVVQLAAGLYGPMLQVNRFISTSSDRYITFQGPDVGGHPNVPTAIFDGSGGTSSMLVVRGWGSRFEFKDILLRNTLGSSISASNGASIQCVNVHQTNCAQGIFWGTYSEIYLSGGVHTFLSGFSGQVLLRGLFLGKHNIGYQIDEDTGTQISDPQYGGPVLTGNGSGRGVSVAERCTGHMRGLMVGNFAVGAELISSSRIHMEYSEFRNNQVAVDLQANCDLFDNNSIFNPTGTYANTVTMNYRGGVNVSGMSAPSLQLVGWADGQATTVNSTTYVDVATPYTMNGYDNKTGTMLKIVLQGQVTGTAGAKNIRLALGDTVIGLITLNAASAGTFYAEIGFIKTTGNNVLPFGFCNTSGGTGVSAGTAEAVSTYLQVTKNIGPGTPQGVRIQASVADAADSINFGTIHCYRAG